MSESYAKLLMEKRVNIHEQSKAIIDRAEAEKRALTVEEKTAYDQHSADMISLRQQADQIIENVEAAKASDESLRKLSEVPRENVGEARPEGKSELRKLIDGDIKAFEVGPRDNSERRFMSPLSGVRRDGIEKRALSVGTPAAGGYTDQTGFYGTLIANLILTANLINAGATVWNTANGDAIQVPITTAHSSAIAVAEGAALTESDPVFAQKSLGAFKYGHIITVSRELITDTSVDLEGYLAMESGRAVGNVFGTALITGGGGGTAPTGLMTTTTLGATGSTGVVGAPNMDDLIKLYHSVITPYRNSPNAAWLLNDLTAAGIRTLKASTAGTYLWQPSLTAGTPDLLLSKPVYTDPNVAVTALNAKSVAFGDLSKYIVRTVQNIRFEQSVDYAFNTDQVVFRCILRGDGVLADQTGAVKHFVGAAS